MFAEREKYIDEQIARLRTMKKWMVQRRHKIDADIYKKSGNLIKEFYASGTDGDYIEYYAVTQIQIKLWRKMPPDLGLQIQCAGRRDSTGHGKESYIRQCI